MKDEFHCIATVNLLETVIKYYQTNSNCYPLEIYSKIDNIVFSEKSFDDKIILLKNEFEADESDGRIFMYALDYCASQVYEEELELINAFLSYMYNQNPYDKKDNENHFKWIDWVERFGKQYY